MAAIKFTDAYIRNLPIRATGYTVRESGGFALRVRPSGAKSWLAIYDYLGKRRNYTLGTYPQLSLKDARIAFMQAREQIVKGLDPAEVKAQQRQEIVEQRVRAERELTFDKLATLYMDKHAKVHKRSWREDQRILDSYILPKWGGRKARDIVREDVLNLVETIAERAPTQANRILALIRKMFNFGLERGKLENNPAHLVKPPGKVIKRDRTLSYQEIRQIWQALEQAENSPALALALRMMLATGQRPGEILNAEWSEFDFDSGWWTIPAARSKNGSSHRVPVTSLFESLINQLRALQPAGESRWLFKSPRGDRPYVYFSMLSTLDQVRDAAGLEHFTCHDLRRTAATLMGEIGTGRTVQDRLLNHADHSISAIYDRHSYDAEARRALEKLGCHIEKIVTGRPRESNVVSLTG